MYNNILVPIVFDHGPKAEEAAAVARELLEPNGKITLLHVVEEILFRVQAAAAGHQGDMDATESRLQLQVIPVGKQNAVARRQVVGHRVERQGAEPAGGQERQEH